MRVVRQKMKLATLLLGFLLVGGSSRAVDWPTESVRLTVRRDDTFLKIGQLLQLDRTMKQNETGWSQMRLDLPDKWKIAAAEVQKDGFRLVLEDGRVFRVPNGEIGRLSFRLLDGGDKKDSEVAKIWADHEQRR